LNLKGGLLPFPRTGCVLLRERNRNRWILHAARFAGTDIKIVILSVAAFQAERRISGSIAVTREPNTTPVNYARTE
jgi:hypothetical protein